MIPELRQVCRSLWSSRSLSAACVLTFAFGIGPAVAVFGLFDRLFLRPLPFERPQDLVQLHLFVNADPRLPQAFLPLAYGNALAARTDVFSGVAWVDGAALVRVVPSVDEPPLTLSGITVNALDVLGVQGLHGRRFDESDIADPVARSVLLTANAWRRRFGESPDVIGKSWTAGPLSYRVIGVLPADFLLPSSRLLEELDGVFAVRVRRLGTGALITAPFARLQPGVSIERATAVAQQVAAVPWADLDARESGRVDTISVEPLQSGMTILVNKYVGLVLGAAFLVFAVTCLNLAVLLHTWSRAEQPSLGLRMALGARLTDVVRLVAMRSMLICATGGLLGWLSYYLSASALLKFVPPELRGFGVQATDQRLMIATVAATALAATVTCFAPSRAAFKTDLLTVLDRRRLSSGSRRWGLSQLLLAGEVAMSVLLGVAAATVVPAFGQLLLQGPGFQTADLYVVTVDHGWSEDAHATFTARESRGRLVREIIRSAPGVESAAVTEVNPLEGQPDRGIFWGPRGLVGNLWTIDGGFFDALGVPLVAGRPFRTDELVGGQPVAIINATGAKTLWPGRRFHEVLGTPLQVGSSTRAIIGVSDDFRSRPGGSVPPALFLPLGTDELRPAQTALPIVVRMAQGQIPNSRKLKSLLDDQLPPGGVTIQSVESSLEPWLARPRLLALLFGVLSLLGVLLVTGASYSLADFEVSRRLNELRIRAALGASRWRLRRLAINSTLPAVFTGVLVGCFLSVWLSGWLKEAGIDRPSGVAAYLAAGATLCSLASIAAVLPLRKLGTSGLSGIVRTTM